MGAGEHQQQRWDRFTIHFGFGLPLRLVDKRRFGRVQLNPPVDQSVPAGIGNLLADELLWRSTWWCERGQDDAHG